MKKYIVVVALLLAILAIGTPLALAYQGPDEGVPAQGSLGVARSNFVDEDGDGVCDLMGTGEGYGPHGPRANQFANGGCGANFVDEDGDGVCDLMGTGQGSGPHGPRTNQFANGGCGANFVDEDGDGVCDLMGTGQGFGPQGQMNGGRGYGGS
jgi:hypothetical protein